MKTVPWRLAPGQFQTLLRDLRFRYHKWDTHACGALKILPESIVLTPPEHDAIVRIGERLADVLARAEARVRSDAGLMKALGIPPAVLPLIQAEPPSERQLARYDLFPTADGGWAVSEFNEDVPGGFNEVIAAPDLVPELHAGCAVPGDFRQAFLNAVPSEGAAALVFATGYSEDLQHMLVLESLLRGRGQETVLCAPSHLCVRRGRPVVDGKPLGAAVRFYPGEWFPLLSNLSVWRRALATLPLLNPLSRLIRQSKRLFALWDEVLDPADRAFMTELAPRTQFFQCDQPPGALHPRADMETATASGVPGRHGDGAVSSPPVPGLSTASAPREDCVLKRAFGRMGDAVVMGNLVTAAEWDEAWREASRAPEEFVLQERFRAAPLWFSGGALYAALGVFLVNGRFAGYYSRASASSFLTHEASYVPTVVEMP